MIKKEVITNQCVCSYCSTGLNFESWREQYFGSFLTIKMTSFLLEANEICLF